MQDQAQKRDAGKVDPLMVEEDLSFALEAVNAVLEYGKAKYGARAGWKQVDMARYHKAWARHRRDRMKYGFKATDDETGLLHAFHEVCNGLFILNDYMEKLTPAQRKKALTFKDPPVPGAKVEPKPRRRARFTREQFDAVLHNFAKGCTYEEIHKLTGVHHTTASRIVKRPEEYRAKFALADSLANAG